MNRPWVSHQCRISSSAGALEVLSGERGSAASLLALLPAEFSTADLIKLRARKGQSVKGSAISMVLNRWRGNGRIEKVNETTWKKIGSSSSGAEDFSSLKLESVHCWWTFFFFRSHFHIFTQNCGLFDTFIDKNLSMSKFFRIFARNFACDT